MNISSSLSLVLVLFISLPAQADSLSEIAAFAEKICFDKVEGHLTRKNIGGTIKGDIPGLAKALGLSVSADGTLKQGEEDYAGIPIDKLPAEIKTPAQCKLELAKVLIEERKEIETKKKQN